MCLGWHVDGLLEAGVQAAMLAVVMTDNAAVCSMPVSASWRCTPACMRFVDLWRVLPVQAAAVESQHPPAWAC
jgi:hypothetical protein